MTSGLLAIKSARAVTAGYGPHGEPFGRLVPTEELVKDIAPKRPGKSPDGGAEDVAASFVREKLGIRSVATTHHTDALTAQTLAGGDTSSSRTVFNPDIDAMTTQALRLAVGDYLAHSGRAEGGRGSLAGHIHLSWSSDDRQMFALAEARREVGWHTPGLTSLHLLSGCAGMIEALNYAEYLLYHSAARDDEDAVVFVTASNDLSAIAHTRGPAEAPGNEDLDQWLFPAIFGEGAGAIVIGRPDPAGDGWMVKDWAIEPVTEDWRVTMPPEQDIPHMVIRARGVGATYRTNVPLAAQRGLQALGDGSGFGDLHRLCLHESNPRMLTAVATGLGAPEATVHSISATVGTLACVSVFTLLDEALHTHRHTPNAPDGLVCALIGDVAGSVAAGHITLRHQTANATTPTA
ncbi:3-oxoacyl-[acyl-carrier-protein] synthase III C-terminal domain-containing protein [Streptomyces sp. NBUL23]|uniref:3-oxoacyl-[acyl-carrier-protein] synthase III C-terminal domain-containing protein n=1 Tax=Streptomyces sp. NBUL23 TaxID=3381354 RepID=UPI0038727C42